MKKYYNSEKFNIRDIHDEFINYIDKKYPIEEYEYQHDIMMDIYTLVEENFAHQEVDTALSDFEPELFVELCESGEWGDGIHGNATGSYFCNEQESLEMILRNPSAVILALEETFGNKDYIQIPKQIIQSPEAIDVIVRFYQIPYRAEEFFWWWKSHVMIPTLEL